MRRVCFVLMVSMVAAMMAGAAFAVVSVTPTPTPIVIEGNITVISPASNTSAKITVQPPQGAATVIRPPVTFIVNERTQIFKDGKEAKLADLAVGNACRALLTKNSEGALVAQVVYAKTVVPPMLTVRGTITEKKVYDTWGRTFKLVIPGVGDAPDRLMWFGVGEKTRVVVDGRPANYDLLADGQTAGVVYAQPPPSMLPVERPILAALVAAKNPPPPPIKHVIGKLVAVDLAGGVIKVAPINATDARVLSFKITKETRIDKFGPAPLGALLPANLAYPGDTVDVAARIPTNTDVVSAIPAAISVVVLPESYVGLIDKVTVNPDGVTGVVWLLPRYPTFAPVPPVPYRVAPATRIVKNGVVVSIGKLAPRDLAELRFFQFRDAKVAAVIAAKSPTRTP